MQLYVGSNTSFKVGNTDVPVQMETNYPWEGKVSITVNPKSKTTFALHLRIPGWLQGEPAPGQLYNFREGTPGAFTLTVNGQPAPYKMEKGYAVIQRDWKKGDVVELNLPMEVKRIASREELSYNTDRVALQRGPLVYCVEGADNEGKAWNVLLPDQTNITTEPYTVLTEPVIALKAQAPVVSISDDGQSVRTDVKTITAIPYYTWCNRGQNPMQVWLPRRIKDVKLNY